MIRGSKIFVVLVLAGALFAPAAVAGGNHHHKRGDVEVLTRNMYFGADLTRSIVAGSVPELLAANAQIFANVEHSDIPARARAIAREIAYHRPDLVGLQEVSQWLSGPIGDPAPATTVEYDQLKSLRFWLAVYGAPYKVVASQQQIAIESPAGAPYNKDFRLVDRDVILAPLHNPSLKLSNALGGQFQTKLTLTSGIGQTITVDRGWTQVDVKAKGERFRFVNTHLESFHPLIRQAQAAELVAPSGAVGSAPGDAVLVGDLNSDPNEGVPGNLAFNVLLAAGMADSWAQVNPSDPGYTYGFDELLEAPTPVGLFNQRIDHVMTRGGISVDRSRLVGLNPNNKTNSGLWPSDHAGVLAELD